MSKDKLTDKSDHKLSTGQMVLIVIIVFTLIPAMVLGVAYFSSQNFKYIVNAYLSKAPDPLGEYFQQFPTREERESQKRELAKQLLHVDVQTAADKLTIINTADEALYSDITKTMIQMDAAQTEKILEIIRGNSVKKDILTSTIQQIKQDQESNIIEKAKYYETLPLPTLMAEINDQLMNQTISLREISQIVEQMKDETAAILLKNIDEEMSRKILSNYENSDKRNKISNLVKQMMGNEQNLVNIAQIYNGDKPDKLVQAIGSDSKYKTNDLSVIYRNLDVVHAGKVLSLINDKEFIFDLLNQIKQDELIARGSDSLTPDIIESMKIQSEYNQQVNDLVKVYSKMDASNIGEIIAKLYKNSTVTKKYSFNNGESIVISDQDIALDILRSMSQKLVAETLASMDNGLASEISKKLALPN